MTTPSDDEFGYHARLLAFTLSTLKTRNEKKVREIFFLFRNRRGALGFGFHSRLFLNFRFFLSHRKSFFSRSCLLFATFLLAMTSENAIFLNVIFVTTLVVL